MVTGFQVPLKERSHVRRPNTMDKNIMLYKICGIQPHLKTKWQLNPRRGHHTRGSEHVDDVAERPTARTKGPDALPFLMQEKYKPRGPRILSEVHTIVVSLKCVYKIFRPSQG